MTGSSTATAPDQESLAKDIERVLSKAHYHKFVLPDGRETKGLDRSATANALFEFDLTGKSLLDIGSLLGYYCIEAKKRGAGQVVGVEAKRRRVKLANSLKRIYGFDDIEYVQGIYPKAAIKQKEFDVVLLLNVVHHLGTVKKADALIRRAAKLCNDRIILCIEPPADDSTDIPEGEKYVDTDEVMRTEIDPATGEREQSRWALLSRGHIRNLLGEFSREVKIIDAPDYKGRFIAIGKK